MTQGRHPEAEEHQRRVLQINKRVLGNDHPSTLKSLHNLAVILQLQGKYAAAETLYRESLEMKQRFLRDGHPLTVGTMFELVDILKLQGKTEEARPYVTELISWGRRAAEQPDTDFITLNAYADLLLTCEPVDLRDPETALVLAKKATSTGGVTKPYVLDTLATAYRMTGDLDSALKTRRQALALLPPGDSTERTRHESALVDLLKEKGQLDGVEQVYRDLLARRRASLPQADPAVGEALTLLGETLVGQHKYSEAEPMLRESLEIRQQAFAEGDWRAADTSVLLAEALAGMGRHLEAEPHLAEGWENLKEDPTAPADRVRRAREFIVRFYEDRGQPDKADQYCQPDGQGE
jgi:tetratricopeptide (TPR) repeat protein